MEEMKISVIIPVYNTAEYLPRCLDSVLQNTYQNLEIICINDGSTDDSAAVLKRYAESDSRIIVVNKINEGVSAARNIGLDIATGSFVSFIDSDDWVHSKYFEVMMHFQIKFNADIVASNYSSVVEMVPNKLLDIDDCKTSSLGFDEIMGCGFLKRIIWGRIYRRKCIEGHRFPKGIKWGEDMIFNVSVLCDAPYLQTVIIDEVLYFYFQRETSAVNTVKTIERIPVCQFYLAQGEKTKDKNQKEIFLLECAKQLLAHRYAAKVCAEYEAYRKCENLVQECSRALRDTSIKCTKKMMIFFFFCCPWAYRLYRIVDDPSLLDWEKAQKQRRKKKNL